MADTPVPDDSEGEQARLLKNAVARLGASLREESERLKQDPLANLPISAAPRDRPDPRLVELGEAVGRLAELEERAVQQAAREVEAATRQAEAAQRLASRALLVAGIAVAVAIVALVAGIVAVVSS
jgi:hypothetical protein